MTFFFIQWVDNRLFIYNNHVVISSPCAPDDFCFLFYGEGVVRKLQQIVTGDWGVARDTRHGG